MSCYSCVLPISWSVLEDIILPSWMDVLRGHRTALSFCQEFIPDHAQRFDLLAYDWSALPTSYLDDIGWSSPGLPLAAQHLRSSVEHARLVETGIAEVATGILMAACKSRASVDLGAPDLFATHPHGGFYSRSCDPPYVQVAGTKNRFHFLEGMFTVTYKPPPHPVYQYVDAHRVPRKLVDLWGALFLSLRALPGVLVLPWDWHWPAWDDERLQGYLMPGEVQQLVPYLEGVVRHREHDPDDDLFPLFADRVRRAAAAGLGLMTLHGGL